MRLGGFFERVAPYLEGRVDHAAAKDALWPDDPQRGGVDGERLAIYARFCRTHRFEVLALFALTRLGVVARGGEAAWASLVEDYFMAHPMRHFELFENGVGFPEWLEGEAARRGLPAWLAEVAQVEWWAWRAEYGPDADPSTSTHEGPLRIAGQVELRPVSCDVAGWMAVVEEDEAAAAREPGGGPQVVVMWRDRQLDGRFAEARPMELVALKMVSAGQTVEDMVRVFRFDEAQLLATILDLRAAGILDGR